MDPWSKVDYSRFIREASMVVEKLPEVVPPLGRVPGRGLLVLPILEALRRQNRGEIAEKGYVLEGFGMRDILAKGAARGGPGAPGAPPLARPRGWPRQVADWATPGSPLAPLGLFPKLPVR